MVPVLQIRSGAAADERGYGCSVFAVRSDVKRRSAILQPKVIPQSKCRKKSRAADVISSRHVESTAVENLQQQRDSRGCAGQRTQERRDLGHDQGASGHWRRLHNAQQGRAAATVWLDCLISPPRFRSACAMSFLPSHTALHSGVMPHLSTGDTGTLSESRKVTMSSLPSDTAT